MLVWRRLKVLGDYCAKSLSNLLVTLRGTEHQINEPAGTTTPLPCEVVP